MKIRNRAFNIKPKKLSEVMEYRVHNHLCNNFVIGNKKALLQTMKIYYLSKSENVFDDLLLTFHVKKEIDDDEYLSFLQHYYQFSRERKEQEMESMASSQKIHNVWIVKPGELTNRGKGIIVCFSLDEIKNIVRSGEKHDDGSLKTYIIQKYI